MKRLVLAIGLTLFANNGFAQEFRAATPVVVLMPHVLNNIEMLEITDAQKGAMRELAQIMSREREDVDSLALELRAELSEITKQYRPDIKQQQKIKQMMLDAEQRRVEMSLECSGKMRQILSEEQWELLIELAEEAY